jgi:histone acetyltransferase (RNA polymerase elongator complex component)
MNKSPGLYCILSLTNGEVSAIIADQKQGIGKQLMDFAEQLSESFNCKRTWLVSGFGREENARPFYKSRGYISTGYRFVLPKYKL